MWTYIRDLHLAKIHMFYHLINFKLHIEYFLILFEILGILAPIGHGKSVLLPAICKREHPG